MHYLSAVTMVQNEALYLKDWIRFHECLGFDHFYIYENDSTDDTMQVLQSYPSNLITIYKFPGRTRQLEAMMHALSSHKHDTRWMAMIDADEYLVPVKENNIPAVLHSYEKFPALCAHWVYFGSNGHKVYENIPVVERFTKRAKNTDRHVKSIVDPTRTVRWVTVHKYTHINGNAVDENKVPIHDLDSRPENPTENIIKVNHYVTKSLAECEERRGRPRPDIDSYHKMPEFFTVHDVNFKEDFRARDLWRKMT